MVSYKALNTIYKYNYLLLTKDIVIIYIIKILVRDLLIKSKHLLFSIKVFFYVYHITHNGAIQYPCIMLCRSDIGMSQNLRYIFH